MTLIDIISTIFELSVDTAGRGELHLHQANMSHDAALYGFRRKIFTIQ